MKRTYLIDMNYKIIEKVILILLLTVSSMTAQAISSRLNEIEERLDIIETKLDSFIATLKGEVTPSGPTDYSLTIDRLEEITGYDLFPMLIDEIENNLENKMPITWQK